MARVTMSTPRPRAAITNATSSLSSSPWSFRLASCRRARISCARLKATEEESAVGESAASKTETTTMTTATTTTTSSISSSPSPSSSSSSSETIELPQWFESALETIGKNPKEVTATLSEAKRESVSMGLGMGILLKDMKRGLPLAAKEQLLDTNANLTPLESKRAQVAKKEFWPFFCFSAIFVNTIPWTPLVLPLVVKFGEKTKLFSKANVVPSQLERSTERRLDLLIRMKERQGEETKK